MKTKDLLMPAIRQYRHNYGSEELLFAYDKDEVDKVVEKLRQKIREMAVIAFNIDPDDLE